MPSIVSGRGMMTRQVACTHCGGACDVGQRAMSIFCPHCRKRLILEDYKITTYYAVRDFSTCGDIVVEKTGHVVAPIKVGNLTVKGKVQGQITARGEVNIGKSGSIKGEIEAASIVIEPGASVDAYMRIGVPGGAPPP